MALTTFLWHLAWVFAYVYCPLLELIYFLHSFDWIIGKFAYQKMWRKTVLCKSQNEGELLILWARNRTLLSSNCTTDPWNTPPKDSLERILISFMKWHIIFCNLEGSTGRVTETWHRALEIIKTLMSSYLISSDFRLQFLSRLTKFLM